MRSFFVTLFLAFSVASASAQSIDVLAARLASCRIELSFDCMVGTDMPVHFTGSLSAQGNCYHLRANGMDIWCDGSTRWSMDTEAKELYVETSNGVGEVLAYRNAISEISFSNVVVTENPDEVSYFFDVSKLDNSWVVTDLRQ